MMRLQAAARTPRKARLPPPAICAARVPIFEPVSPSAIFRERTVDEGFGRRSHYLSPSWNTRPPRASLGRGIRGGPLGEARERALRRYGRSVFSHLRAMVFEDLQIANRVGK